MIKRTRPTAPRELLDPAAEVARERDDAMKYYTASVKSKEKFAFKVYRQRYVKEALEKIFFKKCAYCESLYVVTTPVDIEHFRPKSAVKVGRQKKLGYYWLASEWTNLLPSCNKCNRPIYTRRQATKERLWERRISFLSKMKRSVLQSRAKKSTRSRCC